MYLVIIVLLLCREEALGFQQVHSRYTKVLKVSAANKRVIDAVDELGGKVTAADVAGTGASDIIAAERELLELATRFGGTASVAATSDGDVIFDFGDRPRETLARVDRRERWISRWRRVKPGLAVAGKMAFGLSLFASLAIVTVALAVISQSSSSDSDDNRQSSQVYYSPSPFLYMDLLSPQPRYQGDPREMNFLEAVFSYVFGDGDPNAAKRTAELEAAAEVIRANDGVVLAEQLFPVLADINPEIAKSWRESSIVDEAFVLPIITALGGRPEVVEDTIVYVFDDLVDAAIALPRQNTAKKARGDQESRPSRDYDNAYNEVQSLVLYNQQNIPVLNEQSLQFSRADKDQLVMAGGLGFLNLLAVALLVAKTMTQPDILRLYPAIKAIAIPLALYAFSYNLIPLIRAKNVNATNAGIQSRNNFRRAAAERLARPDNGLRAKLKLAKDATKNAFLRNRRRSKEPTTVFSSADDQKTLETNKLNKIEDDLGDFDARLASLRRRSSSTPS